MTRPGATPNPWTRRHFLATIGATGFLAACGGDDDAGSATTSTTRSTTPTTGEAELAVFQVFGGPIFAPGAMVRAPFLLGDASGPLPVDQSPSEIEVTVRTVGGDVVAGPTTIALHADGLPRGYYPLVFEAGPAGFYDYEIDTGDRKTTSQLQVSEASEVTLVSPGDAMPLVGTSTFDDPMGIDPICTREPMCELHAESLVEPLGRGQKTALLVSTPAFCQIGVCGPILDLMIDEVGSFPDVAFIHAEVYRKPQQSTKEYAPLIGALGLQHEPALYTVDETGTIVERLDFIFDRAELRTTLERLVV